ncbi:uncharacterized protein [Dermacentor albipictus]|uniref:uncharacterized protein isoform X11 n=1 Tax=Dermacentor albipictus TaxID=60249 RepID=UPI0038FC96E7
MRGLPRGSWSEQQGDEQPGQVPVRKRQGDAGLSCVITGSSVGASTVADCTSQASKMARLFREKNPRVVVHEVNRLTTREGTRLKPHLDIETDGEVLVVDLAVVLDAYEGVIKDKARKRHRRMLL